ncbi:hypothetical protein CCH79_00019650 [Gambusia affinis]|uniref:ALMS motif domain-containing protein n=1 Tax=Gambusia affinis TaxID=33528 RepID=A0A315VQN0_GAMAF|nr:hypothetical protein CCH79_00019650 [Gambusia affinis]
MQLCGPSPAFETTSSRVSVPVGERREDFSTSEISPESDGERGILEQSQITLVSLTDTTLQDAVATDDEGLQDSDGPDSITDGQETMETEPTEGAESRLAHQTPSGTADQLLAFLLEFLWSPGRNQQDVFQRRRRALMQRSDRRVQEIKAKRAAARNRPPSRVLVEGVDPGRAAVQTIPRKETAESQSTTEDRKRVERKLRPPPPARRSSPQIGPDVRISDPDQRKRNLSEMHQRTQRYRWAEAGRLRSEQSVLYEQLEEVKQQRAARSRQEDWARNRQRAKEFHRVGAVPPPGSCSRTAAHSDFPPQKTLQKLRAKQTPTF